MQAIAFETTFHNLKETNRNIAIQWKDETKTQGSIKCPTSNNTKHHFIWSAHCSNPISTTRIFHCYIHDINTEYQRLTINKNWGVSFNQWFTNKKPQANYYCLQSGSVGLHFAGIENKHTLNHQKRVWHWTLHTDSTNS